MSRCITLSRTMWEYAPSAAPTTTWRSESSRQRGRFGTQTRFANQRAATKRMPTATMTSVAPTYVKERVYRVALVHEVVEGLDVDEDIGPAERQKADMPRRHCVQCGTRPEVKGCDRHSAPDAG
jgi:hypothetical protein